MSPHELGQLARRHVIAVLVVLALAVGFTYTVKRTPPRYQENATVILTAPESTANPNPFVQSYSRALVDTGDVIVLSMMSPRGQEKARAAGATSAFNVALVNTYNQQYPNYSEPYVTVSATGNDPAEAHRTFAVVSGLFAGDLVALQAQEGTAPIHRIGAHIIGDTGPVAQSGSPKRTYAGLALLTIVAVVMVAKFFDRYPIRLRRLVRHLVRSRQWRETSAKPT